MLTPGSVSLLSEPRAATITGQYASNTNDPPCDLVSEPSRTSSPACPVRLNPNRSLAAATGSLVQAGRVTHVDDGVDSAIDVMNGIHGARHIRFQGFDLRQVRIYSL
jgi:hypothetical protein